MILLTDADPTAAKPAAAQPRCCIFCDPLPAPAPPVAQVPRASFQLFLTDLYDFLILAVACLLLGIVFVSDQVRRLTASLDWRGVDRVLTFITGYFLVLIALYLVFELIGAAQRHPELFTLR